METKLFTFIVLCTICLLFSSWHPDVAGRSVSTQHNISIAGKNISYKATAGYMPLTNSSGQTVAKIFYTAYQEIEVNKNWPVTFIFNGGPGSASLWLHMGSIAPVRVEFKNDKGDAPLSGHAFKDNPNSWIGFTDLVFIDPISTGYSRTAEGVDPKQFYGYDHDIAVFGQFIQQYLLQNDLVANPVFLVGESYGAARAVGLTQYLQKRKINVNGITLISPALNYRVLKFNDTNTLGYIHYLPTYAVAAQYHHRLNQTFQQLSIQELFNKAAFFATHTYAHYLEQPNACTGIPQNIVDSLAAYTGLPATFIIKHQGRINDNDFMTQLLHRESETVGCFDTRFIGLAEKGGYVDPSETNIHNLFVSAFDSYIHQDLAYNNVLPYRATVNLPWSYSTGQIKGYFDVSQTIKSIIVANPQLKVNVICGYYDLSTPLSATQYVINHIGLPLSLQKNIALSVYYSGHMVYITQAANAQLLANGKCFYNGIIGG